VKTAFGKMFVVKNSKPQQENSDFKSKDSQVLLRPELEPQ